jgi:hypothetical protein
MSTANGDEQAVQFLIDFRVIQTTHSDMADGFVQNGGFQIGGRIRLISYWIDEALINYALYIGIVAGIFGYGVLHFLRQRRLRRREPEFDIPNYLRVGLDSADHASRSIETDWVEIHPLPRKIR